MKEVDAARQYFHETIAPITAGFMSLDDLCVAIGGSVASGLSDSHSDIDVYIIWDAERDVWFPKLRQYLFMHKPVKGYQVQFVPLDLTHPQNHLLKRLIMDDSITDLRDDTIKMPMLYEALHYIAVHDPAKKVDKIRGKINQISSQLWRESCFQHCARHIDILEAFYDSEKRNDPVSTTMLYGHALAGLLQILYLAFGKPYPYSKWLFRGLHSIDANTYAAIDKEISARWPGSCSDMIGNIRSVTQITVDKLNEEDNSAVEEAYVSALMNP